MMLLVLGLALTIIGFTDVGLLFFPSRWASVDWEFGTVSAAFEGLPLGTIGLGLMCAAAVARGRRRAMGVLAVVQLLLTLVLIAMLLIFLLDVPVVVRAVDPAMRPTLMKALVKTGSMAVVYVVLYLTFGIWVVRRIRATPKGAGT
jgi:hypothetical protein